MDIIKKHIDTIIILGAFASCIMWMNGRFDDLQKQITSLDKDVAVIKAVMVMQKILPSELASVSEK